MNNSTKVSSAPVKGRLLSLDALRGFDMLWITGGGSLIAVLAEWSGTGWLETLANQMEHATWEGFRFYDLIFPLFMFIAGIAIPLSVKSKLILNVSKKDLILKAFKRMMILIILGFLFNGIFRKGFTDARYASVLAQIGIAYFFAFVIVVFSKSFNIPVLADWHSCRYRMCTAFYSGSGNRGRCTDPRRLHQRVYRPFVFAGPVGLWSRCEYGCNRWSI